MRSLRGDERFRRNVPFPNGRGKDGCRFLGEKIEGARKRKVCRTMKIKLFTVPNILTLCNLLSGCVAAVIALTGGDLRWVFACVVLAALFDFFDGFAARLLRCSSPIGKELDSLADMVSFGFAPAAVLFAVYALCGGADTPWRFVVFVLAAFSALRLAKFNIDENQTKEFIGLPTPACALFFTSCGYLVQEGRLAVAPGAILAVTLLFSFLLVCNVPMFALKFSHYRFAGNELRYLFVAASLVALAVWGVAAVPFVFVAYIAVSVVRHVAFRRK